MFNSQNPLDLTIDFIPAELHTGKVWYVIYYVRNSYGILVRKRIRCNRIRNIQERRRYALVLINKINLQLYSSFYNIKPAESVIKNAVTIEQACIDFQQTKFPTLEPSSIRSYTAYINHIVSCCGNMIVDSIDVKTANKIVSDIKQKNNLSNRTYNNLVSFCRSLWNWFVDMELTENNVFQKVKIPICIQTSKYFKTTIAYSQHSVYI